ncbi:E3 ubiquitin-protein ligase WAV3-like [Phragmites australis]|uniref:E3 ubiquitin-protein ligase WAV3-like n=1 Tax=Phragmites australis TaxID=29695 RepID=UPI002D793373|nr:E3 ubiquitin-protein ligase WAV3-like [Phragmites australis]
MDGPDQRNPCAICLSGMGAGAGQAIFQAECSHTFHFHCISTSVAHGHLVCPLCNAQWNELPFLRPTQPSSMPPTLLRQEPIHGVQPPFQPAEPEVFDDDEQVEPPSGQDGQRQAAAASSGALVVETHTEYSAIARDSSHDNFAVLVHVKAPGMIDGEVAASDAPRAPLDLVTVLDVSGSMSGEKLALLKQAMGFVIDNLGPGDRLSVVSFSTGARRVTRLLRMSDTGKGLAMSAVESLVARGGTNIAEGLRKAAKVLDERRYRNAVSSVILLSDGQDNYTMTRRGEGSAPSYEVLVPPSFMPTGTGNWTPPIHTFGFGNDHDAAAMHVIAETTAGTFSFIENEAVIQDAFAQCIGGLLTVVVQEARIAIACRHPGVRISSVKSGRYESRIDEDGRSASVRVGELYADEERRFLLFLVVPRAEATDGETETTLIKVSCSYRDVAGGANVNVTAEDTVAMRPEHVVDAELSVEVERERVRVEATEDIAAARAAAERGAHQEAVEILENRQRAVAQSGAARRGDATSLALGTELQEMRRRVSNRVSYARSGRAYMLAGISMHTQQRSNSRQLQPLSAAVTPGAGVASMNSMAFINGPAGGARVLDAVAPEGMSNEAAQTSSYETPAMRAMLLRSRRAREASAEQQQPKAGEEPGSSGPNEVVMQ